MYGRNESRLDDLFGLGKGDAAVEAALNFQPTRAELKAAGLKAIQLGIDIAPNIYAPFAPNKENYNAALILGPDRAFWRAWWALGRKDAAMWAKAMGYDTSGLPAPGDYTPARYEEIREPFFKPAPVAAASSSPSPDQYGAAATTAGPPAATEATAAAGTAAAASSVAAPGAAAPAVAALPPAGLGQRKLVWWRKLAWSYVS